MGRSTTSLMHVSWPLSASTKPHMNKTHLHLIQRLWIFGCALDSPIQLWLTRTANFLSFFLRLVHSLTSTLMSYPIKIMIQWLFIASAYLSTLVSLYSEMSAATIVLLWKIFWCLCMHVIMCLLLALTYPVACWLLDRSLTFLLTSWQNSIKYWPPTLWKYKHLRLNNPVIFIYKKQCTLR